jgi:hypothetical protein
MKTSHFRISENVEDDRGQRLDPLTVFSSPLYNFTNGIWAPGIGAFYPSSTYPQAGPTVNAALGAGLPLSADQYSGIPSSNRVKLPFQTQLVRRLNEAGQPQWLANRPGVGVLASPAWWGQNGQEIYTDDSSRGSIW